LRAGRELSEGSIYEAVLFRVSLYYLTLQLWQVDILSYVRLILLSYVRMTFCPWLTHKYCLPQALLTGRKAARSTSKGCLSQVLFTEGPLESFICAFLLPSLYIRIMAST